MITSEAIKNRLWSAANDLQGSMDASRYKDYMLGLMFYKFLSGNTLESYRKLAELPVATKEVDLVAQYEADYAEIVQVLKAQ